MKRVTAEFIGTFVLIFAGIGTAVFSAAFPGVGVGLLGVSLAFGLVVLGCVYALGPVSGCHLNPAVSIGLVAAGRFPSKDLLGYVVAQVLGATVAAGALLLILKSQPGGYDAAATGLASNGYGDHSPGGYSLAAGFLAEVVLTFIFLVVIIGATSRNAPVGFAGVAIGLTLTFIHLAGIPVTNLSVNPARSTGTAVYAGGWALGQLWLFWVAPIAGGALAGFLGKWLFAEDAQGSSAG